MPARRRESDSPGRLSAQVVPVFDFEIVALVSARSNSTPRAVKVDHIGLSFPRSTSHPQSFQELSSHLVGCFTDMFGGDAGEMVEVVIARCAHVFVCQVIQSHSRSVESVH